VNGDAPCHKVYEDSHVLAFLDIAPSAKYHTLIIPKAHARHMHELDPDHAAKMYSVVPRIAGAVYV
jgi:histidine triad (HIT) family protein